MAQTPPNHKAISVLLIDDDADVLDSIAELLAAQEFRLYTAKDGTEALNKIANGACPNIVIVDIRLPNKDGIDIIRRMRGFTGEEIPAIILDDDTSGEEIEAASLNKCFVLRKPQDVGTLPIHINEMAA